MENRVIEGVVSEQLSWKTHQGDEEPLLRQILLAVVTAVRAEIKRRCCPSRRCVSTADTWGTMICFVMATGQSVSNYTPNRLKQHVTNVDLQDGPTLLWAGICNSKVMDIFSTHLQ